MSTPDNPVIDAAHGREDQYIEAVALAKQKASVSFLQRKLLISYHHAEDLLERMISDGQITEYSGRCIEKVQARQIIQLRARIAQLEASYPLPLSIERLQELWAAQSRFHGGEPLKMGHVEFLRLAEVEYGVLGRIPMDEEDGGRIDPARRRMF
ncbi:MAG: DNA translocase FtsK [Comamonas thiooxydans]